MLARILVCGVLVTTVSCEAASGIVVGPGIQSPIHFGLVHQPNPVTPDSTFSVTANVNSRGGGLSGEVVFYLNGSAVATESLIITDLPSFDSPALPPTIDGSGSAQIVLGPLPYGTHALAVTFSSDNESFPTHTIATTHSVADVIPISLELLQFPNPAVEGEMVMLEARLKNVHESGQLPTGYFDFYGWISTPVDFLDYFNRLRMTNGAARVVWPVSSDRLVVRYQGDGNYQAGAAETNLTVVTGSQNRVHVLPALTIQTNQWHLGDRIQIEASISNAVGAIPTGFFGLQVGSATVAYRGANSEGIAFFETEQIAMGPNELRVVYHGGIDREQGSSVPVSVVVLPPKLNILNASDVVRIEWPRTTLGFALEVSSGIGPDAIWEPLNTVATNANALRLDWAPTGSEGLRVFRIRRP